MEQSKKEENIVNKSDEANKEKDSEEKVQLIEKKTIHTNDAERPKSVKIPKSYPIPSNIEPNNLGFEIQFYIIYEEKYIKQRIIQPIVQREIVKMTQVVVNLLIKDKSGKIYPYDKPRIKAANSRTSYQNIINKPYNKSNIPTNSGKMERVIAVNARTLDQKIIYPMACKKTDIFAEIEEKLYFEFPELKSKKIYFVANWNVVERSFTFERNGIKSGDTILIREMNMQRSIELNKYFVKMKLLNL